ncbi:MAG: 5'/3'-nucleotidase SurE [Flavobacteriaceae bacterium]|nr:5'/3'-nucleotidase SurE [Flavobacteriaceae bacterium]
MHKPLILITNDDGINSRGLRRLIEFMQEIGNVFVVAPDSPQSGMGHAITLDSTLSVQKVNLHGLNNNFEAYSCSGTPADCVKLALQELLPEKPDICVSGINHGSNASINVIYSGTMSAAMEAGIEGIPSIGFSLCDFAYDANFESCKNGIKLLVREALQHGMPKDTVLNVNFPKARGEEPYKGIRICRQARANWKEKFDKRQSPSGKDYYWLTGDFRLLDQGEDTDINALEDYFISVVPCQFDLTAHHSIATLNSWNIHDN